MALVYLATNTVNGKRYIGATKHSLKRRKAAHLNRYKHKIRGCPKFYAALRKHGPEAFEWRMIKSFKTAEEAFGYERQLIAELGPEYNVTLGGEAPGYHLSPNRKPVICLENGNIFPSITACANFYKADISTVCSVCNNDGIELIQGKHFVYYTKYLSEAERTELIDEIDKKRVERRKRGGSDYPLTPVLNGKDILGRSAAGPMKNAKSVLCVTTGEQFPSISAAASHYKVSKTAIVELCQGKRNRKTAGGLVFQYAEAA